MTWWPFPGRRERVRRQAADWVARLNGPHTEAERRAFERWRGADPEHAAAYARLAALLEVAGRLPAQPGPAAVSWGGWASSRIVVAAAGIACALLVAAWLFARADPPGVSGERYATFASNPERSRALALADGSRVVLAPSSAIEADLGPDVRRIRLARGAARFTVAHEPRPFVVRAGEAEIVAHGTQFVVRLGAHETMVSLIEGRVDVSYPPVPGHSERRTRHLAPGDRLTVPVGPLAAARETGQRPAPAPPAMIAFDDRPLAEVLARVNAQASPPVRLADPALGALRVSGAFPTGDGAGFARSIAAALDLDVARSAGALWLRRPQPGRKNSGG